MTGNPTKAESEIYKIFVKFWKGDMDNKVYEAFKKNVRKRFEENILPLSQGSSEARLLRMEVTKDKKEK